MAGQGNLGRGEILDLCKKRGVRFLRLQFTDILGTNKNVEVPESQFGKALDGEIAFDASKSRTCCCGPTSGPSASFHGKRREAASPASSATSR
jgi:hypothetical protein